MVRFKYYFLLFCFFGAVHQAASQSARPDIGLQIDSLIEVQPGLNALDILLYNDTTEDFDGQVELVLPSGLRSFGESNIVVQVKAGKKRYLSVKLQSQELSRLKAKELTVNLRDRDGALIVQKSVQMVVAKNRSVTLMDISDLQYLREVGDSVYVKLRILNNGTTDEQVRLVLSSPDRLGQRDFKALPLSLYAGQDTLIRIGVLVERYMLQLPQYTLRVSGLYENNDLFGNATISFQNMASNRNYQQMYDTDNLIYNYSSNFVDVQMDQSLGGTPMYALRSEGAYGLMGGKLRYNLHATQWGDILTRPNISNTFLEYEKDNKTWAIGNLQESLEAPFYGRGASFAVTDSMKDNHFSVGAVERSSDLLGYYGAVDNPGISAFARLILADQHQDRKRYEGQLYFDDNRMDSTHSLLWANSFDLLPKGKAEQIQLRGFMAAGVSSYHADSFEDAFVLPSAAVGLKLIGRTRRNLSYSSENFYSTPYYTGNRRGAVQFSQRVNKTWGKTGYGGGFSYSRYNPSYLNPRFQAQDNSLLKLDMTFYRSVSSFVTLNIQPSYNSEEADYWMINERTRLRTRSWQLMGTANIRSKNYKHNLYTSVETGLITIEEDSDKSFILRSNLTYNYGKLGISAMYQRGAFRVFEVLNDYLINGSSGSRMMLSASYGGTLSNNKLSWNTSLVAHASTSYGNTYSTNLSAAYRVLRNTLLTGNVRYSYTEGMGDYRYDYSNFRIGIRQNLKSRNLDRPAVRTGSLNVFCYYDNNHNNIFDAGDEIAAGYNFLVGGVNFVTDRKGRAEYKKLPYGERVLFFPASNGYQGLSRVIDLQSRSVSVAIPLQKVTQVRGGLIIRYDAKLSLEANLDLDLYTIVARDQDNHIFEVPTNAQGSFLFSLPQGEYSIYIKSDTFPENIFSEDNVRTVTVEIGKNQELEPFVLQVRNKTIEVKRFGN